jgi:hypothetical protein
LRKVVVLALWALIPFEALAQAQPPQKLLVLDVAGDLLDGPAFVDVVDAYINDMGVAAELSSVESPPTTYQKWIELAIERGTNKGAIGSLWTEPVEGEADALNVFLVVLAQRTQATILLPVELGIKRGPMLYRSLAAATRMILDTNLLADLGAVAQVAQAEEPPEPWEPGTQNDPQKARKAEVQIEDHTKRSLGLAILYTGDLGIKGSSYNQGLATDLRLYMRPELSVMVGGGALFSSQATASTITARQVRFPFLIGMGGHLALRRVTLGLTLFWMAEVVRLAGLEWPAETIEVDDSESALDMGGGGELSVHTPLWKNVSALFGLAVAGMVVSHQYKALGADWFPSNPLRLWFRAGISFDGL